MKHLYEALLLSVPGIGGVRLQKLQERFGDAEHAWKAARQELQESSCLSAQEINGLLETRECTDIAAIKKNWTGKGIRICTRIGFGISRLIA